MISKEGKAAVAGMIPFTTLSRVTKKFLTSAAEAVKNLVI